VALDDPSEKLDVGIYPELADASDKHSQFATTFPIYIMERKKAPIAPQSLVADGDPDELNDDLDSHDQTPREESEMMTEEWVRVNDKAPIWMRWV